MNVFRLPPVEPWPSELFESYSILDLEALIDGAHAEIVQRRSAATDAAVDTCADCGELLHADSTLCAACGAPHVPKNERQVAQSLDGISAPPAEEVNLTVTVHGCTCGGRGICTACVLESYEPSVAERLMVSALDATEKALARMPDVTELHPRSVRVAPSGFGGFGRQGGAS